MRKCINLNIKTIDNISLYILALPMLLFVWGWLKVPVAIVMTGLLVYSLFCIRSKTEETWNVPIPALIIIIAFSGLLCYTCGMGGNYPQSYDYSARTAILRDLIELDWPVYYSETNTSLAYYFGFWLPAAVVGKIGGALCGGAVGWKCGETALWLWSSICMSLFFLNICHTLYKGRASSERIYKIIAVILVVFLSVGPIHIIGFLLSSFLGWGSFKDLAVTHISHWASIDYISYGWEDGFWTQMMYVFNQAIPAYLATVWWYRKRDHFKAYGPLLLILSIQAVYPTIGLFLIMAFYVLYTLISRKKRIRDIIKSTNIFSACMILVILLFYLGMNLPHSGWKNFVDTAWYKYLELILVQILVYTLPYVIVVKKNIKDLLCNASYTLIILCIILATLGTEVYDLCARAIIPAQIILYLMLCGLIIENRLCSKEKLVCTGILSIALLSPLIDQMDMLEKAHVYGTMKVENNNEYTLRNKFYSNSGWNINQYLIENPQDSLFFSLVGKSDKEAVSLPIIKSSKDKTYIEQVTMKKDDLDEVMEALEFLSEEEKNRFIAEVEGWNEDNIHVFTFAGGMVSYHARVNTKLGEAEISWNNQNTAYKVNGWPEIFDFSITNKSDEIIYPSDLEDGSKRGVVVVLFNEKNEIIQYTYTYLDAVIFPGQTKTIQVQVPKVTAGSYTVGVGIFQDPDKNQQGAYGLDQCISKYYNVSFY